MSSGSGGSGIIPVRSDEKTAVFIDGANLYATAKALEFDIDYLKLRDYFKQNCRLVRLFYYTALLEIDRGEFNPLQPLVDWLAYNGFHMVVKKAKEFINPLTGVRKLKGNMDIELAIDMMQMAKYVDHIVLFSGDGDFRRLVEEVQRDGVKVTVVSSVTTKPPMIADELRRQCDLFVDVNDLRHLSRHRKRNSNYENIPKMDGNAKEETYGKEIITTEEN
jgi:uncharacterized LabA/DUF88 family protein